jgi:hypothetical protein
MALGIHVDPERTQLVGYQLHLLEQAVDRLLLPKHGVVELGQVSVTVGEFLL